MNVGKKSVGLSAGTRGARYSVSSSGRRTAAVGVPGTGVGYTSSRGSGGKRSSGGRASAPLLPPSKPGLFAPKHEKEFHKALQTYAKSDAEAARDLFQRSSA